LLEDSDRLGTVPRAVALIFERLNRTVKESKGALSFSIRNSYIELYNEDLLDLLAGELSPEERPAVTIREDKAGGILWSGLRELRVDSPADVMANLEAGSALRQTNSTDMNSQSSRSHAIFSLVLTQRKYAGLGPPPSVAGPASPRASRLGASRQSFASPTSARVSSPGPGNRPTTPSGIPERPNSRFGLRPSSVMGNTLQAPSDLDEWVTVTSKLNFVDLAGSERLKRTSAAGERVKEGISINAGLHALGNVISALGDPAKARQTTHIPYRCARLALLRELAYGSLLQRQQADAPPARQVCRLFQTYSTSQY
jgi:kinesin family protein 4/21/27